MSLLCINKSNEECSPNETQCNPGGGKCIRIEDIPHSARLHAGYSVYKRNVVAMQHSVIRDPGAYGLKISRVPHSFMRATMYKKVLEDCLYSKKFAAGWC